MAVVTTNRPPLQADTLELINSELADRLKRVSDAGSQIDTKAVLLVGYAGASAAFLVTQHPQPVLAGLAYSAYAAAAVFGIWVYAVSTYEDVPKARRLFNEYAMRQKPEALAALAAQRVNAIEVNARKNQQKARRWQAALITLVIGVALMLAALVAHTESHGKTSGGRPHAAAARPGRFGP